MLIRSGFAALQLRPDLLLLILYFNFMHAFISTKVHGVLDYMSGLLILASLWLFGFAHLGGAPLFTPVVFGSLQLLMVIFTNYELGIIKVISIQLHLW